MIPYTPTAVVRPFQNDPPAVFLHSVREILTDIGYPREGYQWEIGLDGDLVFIQILHWRPDAITGQYDWGPGGRRYLSRTMTISDIVRTVFGTALAYEEHEVREHFTYKGARVFGPHMDVQALVEVAERLDVRP